jgi:predicted phosphoribosyltransferase
VSDFANLADGGTRLAPLLREALAEVPEPLLLPVLPNGVPVAVGVASTWPVEVRALAVTRGDDGVVVHPEADVAGRHVVVVDDGVETGTVARAAVAPLRAAGVASLTLAVPVCPREALADLALRYDRIIAAVRPLVRRDLAWHYADFDTIDEATALQRLAEHSDRLT